MRNDFRAKLQWRYVLQRRNFNVRNFGVGDEKRLDSVRWIALLGSRTVRLHLGLCMSNRAGHICVRQFGYCGADARFGGADACTDTAAASAAVLLDCDRSSVRSSGHRYLRNTTLRQWWRNGSALAVHVA